MLPGRTPHLVTGGDNDPQIPTLDKCIELPAEKLQNQLMKDRRHRQEVQVAVGEFDPTIRGEREELLFGPLALWRE